MILDSHHPIPVLAISPTQTRATQVRFSPGAQAVMRTALTTSTFHYYGIPPPPRIPWLALVISASFHAVLLLGWNHHAVVKKAPIVAEAAIEMLVMPDLKEDEEKPKILSDDEPLAEPSVQVPMLQDIPVQVPLDASFTQLVDYTIPAKIDSAPNSLTAIPLNIQRGRPDTSSIKDLFNISDLDRPPEPIIQPPPVFPYELKADVSYAHVRVGFIVTAGGDVIFPYIISSTHRGFERPALDGVIKWKFKPGMKLGRKVNTRVIQPLDFSINDGQ